MSKAEIIHPCPGIPLRIFITDKPIACHIIFGPFAYTAVRLSLMLQAYVSCLYRVHICSVHTPANVLILVGRIRQAETLLKLLAQKAYKGWLQDEAKTSLQDIAAFVANLPCDFSSKR
jgi:hypothetical protein